MLSDDTFTYLIFERFYENNMKWTLHIVDLAMFAAPNASQSSDSTEPIVCSFLTENTCTLTR